MNIHLDTNTVIALLTDNPPAVRQKFREARSRGDMISISSIVLFELWFGAAKGTRWDENARRIRDFLASNVAVVSFDDAAQTAGELRAALKKAGTPIGPYDLLIAAQAVRAGATLVTSNVREFSRVPGLIWEDWTA